MPNGNMTNAKMEAIGQMQRAVRAIDRALEILDQAFARALVSEQREIFRVATMLNERREAARRFIRHLEAAEVRVGRPSDESYARLDRALGRMQRIEVETNSVRRILRVVAALGRATRSTREEVSRRTV